MNLKMMIDCVSCEYCQSIFEHTPNGTFQRLGKGCFYAPHWGKNIVTIEKCPKYFTQVDIDTMSGNEKYASYLMYLSTRSWYCLENRKDRDFLNKDALPCDVAAEQIDNLLYDMIELIDDEEE